MRLRPMPVVMVSTLTQEGAETTLQALELGAFDCVAKPAAADFADAFEDLAEKVKAAGASRVRTAPPQRPTPARPTDFRSNGKIIAIGASTGGVEALIAVLSAMPENCPPTVVTQHMPATFTRSFAARLDRLCAPTVTEAEDGEPLAPGHVYVAPGGVSHLEVAHGTKLTCRLRDSELVNGHRPSVDVLFHSVAAACGARSVGLILTGMGKDGAKGLAAMRNAGARTFGQDELSCVVYGMPKAAFELGAVERQAPLSELSRLVIEACTSAAKDSTTREIV
jgi:two-component system chemotaxis response regulator CheB